MLKVLLREPIGSGFQKAPNQQTVLAERVVNYLLVEGKIDEQFQKKIAEVPPHGWLLFHEPQGNPVLIPRDNIAYIQEQLN